MRWLTAVDKMNTAVLKRELLKQRISFCFALFNVCTFLAWANVRAYFAFVGDHYADRRFLGRTLFLYPTWGLCWFISFILVAQSLLQCKRATWYGIVALAVDAVPAIVAVLFALYGYWMLLSSQ